MKAPRQPLFLARDTYRRRRLMDAARVLPVFGAVLFLVPMLWADGGRTSQGKIYIFVAWLALIILAAAISARLRNRSEAGDEGEDD